MTIDSIALWGGAHTLFPCTSRFGSCATDSLAQKEQEAWQTLARECPNGSLLEKNSMFDMLRGAEKIYLLHVTQAFASIQAQGTLYPSGGCLVGSIYCAPVFKEGDAFRLHNLGAYILHREAPKVAQYLGTDPGKVTPLVAEITLQRDNYSGLVGIDYLKLGEIHLQIFQQLEYLLGFEERSMLRHQVVSRIRNSMEFLLLCSRTFFDNFHLDSAIFFELLRASIRDLPILGYLLFEVLSEYLMLYSTTPRSLMLKERGEFDNTVYKDMLFGSYPSMAGHFRLSEFAPSKEQITEVCRKNTDLAPSHVFEYIQKRLSFLVCLRCLTTKSETLPWHYTRWDFDRLLERFGPLMGHLIHRELRSFGRYPDFYFYFDQYKALHAWNYWNNMGMVLPFSATFPKGELGINPAYPGVRCKWYKPKRVEKDFIDDLEPLTLSVAPRLIDTRYTAMRGGDIRLEGKTVLPTSHSEQGIKSH